jgi:hypothetical protein
MRLRTTILSAAVLVLSAPLLSAQVTYDYTGNNFTVFNAEDQKTNFYTGADNITGSITLATALGDNLGFGGGNPGDNITADITQFSFSVNGTIQTITNTSSGLHFENFVVWTDASGNIIYAQIALNGDPTVGQIQIQDSVAPNSPNYLPSNVTGQDSASYPGVLGDSNVEEGQTAQAGGIGTWKIAGKSVDSIVNPSATPEPSSFVLMFTALLGFGLVARKEIATRLLHAGRTNS